MRMGGSRTAWALGTGPRPAPLLRAKENVLLILKSEEKFELLGQKHLICKVLFYTEAVIKSEF